MKFTEAKLEQAFTALLGNEGYPHFVGNSLVRTSVDEVLIEEDLKTYLLTRYQSASPTETEAKTIILQLKTLSSADLYESNKKLCGGCQTALFSKEEADHTRIVMFHALILQDWTVSDKVRIWTSLLLSLNFNIQPKPIFTSVSIKHR